MAWTQEQLAAIEHAIAAGKTRVRYQDPAGGTHEVQYSSLDDMMRVRSLIRQELGMANPPTTILARHDRDL